MTIRERIRVGRLRSGDTRAVGALYDEFAPALYRYCLRLSGNRCDAEDLTQDVFVAAVKGLDRFEGRSSVKTWLYRIAHLRWLSLAGSKAALRHVEGDIGDRSTPQSDVALALDMERAIGDLPSAQRDAFVLVKCEGLTCGEAAAVLGIPEGTVRYHVHEAVHKLRRSLSETPTEAASAPNLADKGLP